MHDENPQTTQAIRILRDRGWPGMSDREVADVLSSAPGFKLSQLQAISIDDVRAWADILRGAGIVNVPRSAA